MISFDMGGTTAKVCLIENGSPSTASQIEIGRMKMQSGSGLPISVPGIDLVEIGAGGGSIARAEMGTIAVGPDSAGASPGPISYAAGGLEPTVTDADLVLGYLNPGYFLGGRMKLDKAAAENGIEERLARPLGLVDGRGGVGHAYGGEFQHEEEPSDWRRSRGERTPVATLLSGLEERDLSMPPGWPER